MATETPYLLREIVVPQGLLLLTGSITLDSTQQLQLVNDSISPGNNMVYGTNGSGLKGWYSNSGGGGAFWPLTGTGTLTGSVTIDPSASSWSIVLGTVSNRAPIVLNTAGSFELNDDDQIVYSSSITTTSGAGLTITTYDDIGFTGNSAQINFVGANITIQGSSGFPGLVYSADYSANFGFQSLVDKNYTDTHFWKLSGQTILSSASVLTNTGFIMGVGSVISSGAVFRTTISGNLRTAQLRGYSFSTTTQATVGSSFDTGTSVASLDFTLRDTGSLTTGITGATNSAGLLVTDNINSTGLYYNANYSTSGVANRGNRWIPDKEYTDNTAYYYAIAFQ